MDRGDLPVLSAASWADLSGHVSVVTGGNSGIGLGLAAGLVAAGATVSLWGTSPRKNALAVERLRGGPGRVSSLVCDVSDERAVTDLMASVAQQYGRLDSCFANAGIGAITQPLLDTTLERFHRISRVDLDGAFVTIREAARHMVAFGQGGSIVAASSVSVHFGVPATMPTPSAKRVSSPS